MTTKTYRALKPFVHQNIRRSAGDDVALSAEQAEFLRHGGFIESIATVAEAPAAGSDMSAPITTEPQPDDADQKRRKGGRP